MKNAIQRKVNFVLITVSGRRLAVALSAVLGLAGMQSKANAALITPIGTLGTGNQSVANAINDSGTAVGYSFTSTLNTSNEPVAYNASNGLTDIGSLGYNPASALSISNSGIIVGYSAYNGAGQEEGFVYNSSNGNMSVLPVFTGGTVSYASGVNFSGNVTGYGSITGGKNALIYNAATSTPTNLGTLNGLGKTSWGEAINNSNQIVGYSTYSSSTVTHAFLYTPTNPSNPSVGTMVDLGGLGASNLITQAFALNSSAEVTGVSTVTSGVTHAFVLTGAAGTPLTDLGVLGTGLNSRGLGINDAGDVVGYSFTVGTTLAHAFIDLPTSANGGTYGPMIDLNTYLAAYDPADAAFWTLTQAYGINNNGMVVGDGTYDPDGIPADSETIGFVLNVTPLLTAVPEPTSVVMVALATAGMLGRRRRTPAR